MMKMRIRAWAKRKLKELNKRYNPSPGIRDGLWFELPGVNSISSVKGEWIVFDIQSNGSPDSFIVCLGPYILKVIPFNAGKIPCCPGDQLKLKLSQLFGILHGRITAADKLLGLVEKLSSDVQEITKRSYDDPDRYACCQAS